MFCRINFNLQNYTYFRKKTNQLATIVINNVGFFPKRASFLPNSDTKVTQNGKFPCIQSTPRCHGLKYFYYICIPKNHSGSNGIHYTSDRGCSDRCSAAGSQLAVGPQSERCPQFHHWRQVRQLDGLRCAFGYPCRRPEYYRHGTIGILLRLVGLVVHHRGWPGIAGTGTVLCRTAPPQWLLYPA